MSNLFQLIVLIPTTIVSLIWVMAVIKGAEKYNSIISSIDGEQYKFKDYFYIGFQILEWIRFDVRSEANRKKVSEISEIYGAKYAEFYYFVKTGGEVTYAITLLMVVLILSVLSNNVGFCVFGIAFSFILVWYVRETFNDKVEERREALLSEFPQVLSKMTLLVNAGMMLRDAWKKVSLGKEGVIYQEMRITLDEFQNGVSEVEAYHNFADRCSLKEMRKFAALVEQGLTKGSSDLALFLQDMSDELWSEKKSMVTQKVAKASTKLLIVSTLMFAGVLEMIIVPILGSL